MLQRGAGRKVGKSLGGRGEKVQVGKTCKRGRAIRLMFYR